MENAHVGVGADEDGRVLPGTITRARTQVHGDGGLGVAGAGAVMVAVGDRVFAQARHSGVEGVAGNAGTGVGAAFGYAGREREGRVAEAYVGTGLRVGHFGCRGVLGVDPVVRARSAAVVAVQFVHHHVPVHGDLAGVLLMVVACGPPSPVDGPILRGEHHGVLATAVEGLHIGHDHGRLLRGLLMPVDHHGVHEERGIAPRGLHDIWPRVVPGQVGAAHPAATVGLAGQVIPPCTGD